MKNFSLKVNILGGVKMKLSLNLFFVTNQISERKTYIYEEQIKKNKKQTSQLCLKTYFKSIFEYFQTIVETNFYADMETPVTGMSILASMTLP